MSEESRDSVNVASGGRDQSSGGREEGRGAMDVAMKQVVEEQKSERTLKIVFGVIVAIVVVIVVICLYSVMTQKCPSTSDSSYTPSLTCAGANLLQQMGNTLNWLQTHWWAFIIIPVAVGVGGALFRLRITKTNVVDPKPPDPKPIDPPKPPEPKTDVK
jgi:hypothetical protein